MEAVMVLLIVVVVVGSLTPSAQRTLQRARINRAARASAADFYLAQSLAQRDRQPVTITVDSSAKTITLKISSPDTVLQRRYYGTEGSYKVNRLWASPASVLVYPTGMSSAAITLNFNDGYVTRQVTMSRAGQILVLH